HLVLANAGIGALEGTLLVYIYNVRTMPTIVLMVLANYFSAWVGLVWLMDVIKEQYEFELYNTWALTWRMMGVAFLVTLILEWPFVAACFFGQPKGFRKSFIATLLLHVASYTLLIGLYSLVSGTSLYTRMQIVPLDHMDLPDDIRVYFIADDDGDV